MSTVSVRKVIEDSLAGLLVTCVVAFITMTYQFAQMRTDMEGVRRDLTRIEANVAALMTRSTYWRGDAEGEEVLRIARAIEKTKNPGLAILPSAEASQEK